MFYFHALDSQINEDFVLGNLSCVIAWGFHIGIYQIKCLHTIIQKKNQYLNKVLHLVASSSFEKILITTLGIPFKSLLCYDLHLVCKCGYV
jgi:hypothetical protein